MNLRIVIVVNTEGIETIRIVSSPDEEAEAEILLSKIKDELQALDAKVKRLEKGKGKEQRAREGGIHRKLPLKLR